MKIFLIIYNLAMNKHCVCFLYVNFKFDIIFQSNQVSPEKIDKLNLSIILQALLELTVISIKQRYSNYI